MAERLSSTERAQRTVLSVEMACYHAVHDWPGGVGAVAGALGWNPHTLQKKLSPTVETHKLLAAEVQAILAYTRDTRILDAMTAPVDAMWFWMPDVDAACGEILSEAGLASERLGALIMKIVRAIEDGDISPDEYAVLERDGLLVIQSVKTALEKAKAKRDRVWAVAG